jgi:hypothetical protein
MSYCTNPSNQLLEPIQTTRRDVLRLGGLACATALLPPWLSGCGGSDLAPIQVVRNDIPYPTERNLLIGYMLSTWEFEREGLSLSQIVTLDHDTSAVLQTIGQASLPKIFKGDLGSILGYQFDTLTRYFVSLRLTVPLGQPVPRSIRHRLVFSNGHSVEGGVLSPRTGESPLVIASPVRGNRMVFVNQSTMAYHFDSTLFMQGNIYTSERYAFDSVQINDTLNEFYAGNDPKDNTAYFNYGSALYAVADGTVVQTADNRPENHGDAHDVVLNTLSDYAGNYVMLDIGSSRYACYAHCIPGSLTVKPGDRVSKGQMIARLGNSGNSSGPHLHFQICDAPDFFWSGGIPFVLETYTKIGEAFGAITPGQLVTHSMMEETTVIDIAA